MLAPSLPSDFVSEHRGVAPTDRAPTPLPPAPAPGAAVASAFVTLDPIADYTVQRFTGRPVAEMQEVNEREIAERKKADRGLALFNGAAPAVIADAKLVPHPGDAKRADIIVGGNAAEYGADAVRDVIRDHKSKPGARPLTAVSFSNWVESAWKHVDPKGGERGRQASAANGGDLNPKNFNTEHDWVSACRQAFGAMSPEQEQGAHDAWRKEHGQH